MRYLLLIALATILPLNATELKILENCDKAANEPVDLNDIDPNVDLSGVLDYAYKMGYCMGLNMRAGYHDATIDPYTH